MIIIQHYVIENDKLIISGVSIWNKNGWKLEGLPLQHNIKRIVKTKLHTAVDSLEFNEYMSNDDLLLIVKSQIKMENTCVLT